MADIQSLIDCIRNQEFVIQGLRHRIARHDANREVLMVKVHRLEMRLFALTGRQEGQQVH